MFGYPSRCKTGLARSCAVHTNSKYCKIPAFIVNDNWELTVQHWLTIFEAKTLIYVANNLTWMDKYYSVYQHCDSWGQVTSAASVVRKCTKWADIQSIAHSNSHWLLPRVKSSIEFKNRKLLYNTALLYLIYFLSESTDVVNTCFRSAANIKKIIVETFHIVYYISSPIIMIWYKIWAIYAFRPAYLNIIHEY